MAFYVCKSSARHQSSAAQASVLGVSGRKWALMCQRKGVVAAIARATNFHVSALHRALQFLKLGSLRVSKETATNENKLQGAHASFSSNAAPRIADAAAAKMSVDADLGITDAALADRDQACGAQMIRRGKRGDDESGTDSSDTDSDADDKQPLLTGGLREEDGPSASLQIAWMRAKDGGASASGGSPDFSTIVHDALSRRSYLFERGQLWALDHYTSSFTPFGTAPLRELCGASSGPLARLHEIHGRGCRFAVGRPRGFSPFLRR
jgi:hypothetical protein